LTWIKFALLRPGELCRQGLRRSRARV